MKKFIFILLSLFIGELVYADDGNNVKSYSYFEGQAGVGWTTTDAKIDKLLIPHTTVWYFLWSLYIS